MYNHVTLIQINNSIINLIRSINKSKKYILFGINFIPNDVIDDNNSEGICLTNKLTRIVFINNNFVNSIS